MLGQCISCVEPSLDLSCVEESLARSAAYPSFGPDGGQGHTKDDIRLLRIAAPVQITVRAACDDSAVL